MNGAAGSRFRTRSVLVAALAAAFVLAGCRAGGLAFRQDDRVRVVAPSARSTVELPVTVRWEAEGLDPASGDVAFAVFVDRAPIKVGQRIDAVGDDACRATPGCPDAGYLRERGVVVTSETEVVLETLADLRDGAHGKDRHDVTVVLLEAGERRTEAAWSVVFFVERGES